MDARTLRCRVAPRRTQLWTTSCFGRPCARGPALGSSLASCCCCPAARCLCCCAGGVRVVAAARPRPSLVAARPRPSWLLRFFFRRVPTSLVFRHRVPCLETDKLRLERRVTLQPHEIAGDHTSSHLDCSTCPVDGVGRTRVSHSAKGVLCVHESRRVCMSVCMCVRFLRTSTSHSGRSRAGAEAPHLKDITAVTWAAASGRPHRVKFFQEMCVSACYRGVPTCLPRCMSVT